MRYNPKGGAVRTMRLTERDEAEDGSLVKRVVSAPGFIVRLAHVPGQRASDVRRSFSRFCLTNGIIFHPCEMNEGTYSKRTGKPVDGSVPTPSAYQVMGEPSALLALAQHWTIGECHQALAIRVPCVASGNGDERAPTPSGSVFGKPATVKATGAALAEQGNAVRTAQRKSWGLMGDSVK